MSSSLNLFILLSNCKGLNGFSPKFATCVHLIWIISSFSPCISRCKRARGPPLHNQFLELACQDIRESAGLNLVCLNLEVSGPAGLNLVGLNLEFSGPASLKMPPKEICNKEKIAYRISCGPPKAPGPLVTTLATPPLDGPAHYRIPG